MKTVRRILILVALCLLPGCWDIKTIQDVNYITAIGLDYKDGKYVLYAQLLDFASVAKKQDGKPSEPAPVWTGKGTGETVDMALSHMYKEAQQKMFFGHVNAIVLSENVLKNGNTELLDGFMRQRESRYMAWVFGTRQPIEEVFTALPFFNLSPLDSILHNPMVVYKERSFIQPMKFQRYMALLKEPGNTVLLPSISVDSKVWKKNKEPDAKLTVDGVFALRQSTYMGWFPHGDLQGIRWIQESTNHTSIRLERNGKHVAVVSLESPKRSMSINSSGSETKLHIRIKIKGRVAEVVENMSETFLTEETQREIQDQVISTYKRGLSRKTDLLGLEHALYHDRFRLWAKKTDYGSRPIVGLSLETVRVSFEIENSGMYKLKKKRGGPEY